jgi:hypothetical protein
MGEKARFWHDKWLDGMAPISVAPNLFKKACFKKRTVAKELCNNSWISAARHISTRQELIEFVKLWSHLKNVRLDNLSFFIKKNTLFVSKFLSPLIF